MTNEILNAIQTRRSVRSFKGTQIENDTLSAVIEAGRVAPSGVNIQACHMIVLQNNEKLTQIAKIIFEQLSSLDENNPIHSNYKHAIARSKSAGESYNFFYGAPTLIITANKESNPNAFSDCACVLENMMIAATSLNIGSCWINQPRWLDHNAAVRGFFSDIGLKDDEIICGALALGFPASDIPAPPEKKGNPVTYVK